MKPKRTILCVDDNDQSLSHRKVMLETRGYRVASYSRGEPALERFKQGGIDLVVTDMAMPGMDGPPDGAGAFGRGVTQRNLRDGTTKRFHLCRCCCKPSAC